MNVGLSNIGTSKLILMEFHYMYCISNDPAYVSQSPSRRSLFATLNDVLFVVFVLIPELGNMEIYATVWLKF